MNHNYNLGVLASWSLGGSLASHRPSGLVSSSDDGFVRGTRRPLLRGKLCSKDGIKVTGARGGEHCLCCKDVTSLVEALVANQALDQKRLSDQELTLVEHQHGLGAWL